jgi:hypothetical protein
MSDRVWCVFQKLPGERCATLTALCRSRELAERLVVLERAEALAAAEPSSEWVVTAWTILEDEGDELERIEEISHVLDPMRRGVTSTPEERPE